MADWQQKRNFFGLPVEKFHQPLALWHPSGHYIIAAAAHGFVYVFHVGSAKVTSCLLFSSARSAFHCLRVCQLQQVLRAHARAMSMPQRQVCHGPCAFPLQAVHNFKAHEKNVRAMSYDPHDQTLVTGSFDRRCQIWQDTALCAQTGS